MKKLGMLLIAVALITGIVSCSGESYCLTIASTEGGLVIAPGEGTFAYELGAVVDLMTGTEESYYFVGWTGDVATIAGVNTAATTITMNADYSITANFVEGWATFPNPDVGVAIRGDISERGYLFPSDVQDHNPLH